MKLLLAAAVAVHAASGAGAKKAAAKQPKRTLETLIATVIEKGVTKTDAIPVLADSGDGPTVTTRAVRYKKESTPDGKMHAFAVVQQDSQPSALIWTVLKREQRSDGRYIDGYELWVSTTGDLIRAWRAHGKVGEQIGERLTKQDPLAVAAFEQEKRFYTTQAFEIKFSTD